MNTKISKQLLSVVLLISMLLQSCISFAYAGSTKSSATVAASQVTETGYVNINGISLLYDQSLNDNGDGTYTIGLDLSSTLVYQDKSENQGQAKYGYYKAPITGTYLFELWGGDGANGQNTSYSDGGKGGKGAYLTYSLTMNKYVKKITERIS